MGFDDDVDAARERLQAALQDEVVTFDRMGALASVLDLIVTRLKSRRLRFVIVQDPDEDPAIAVLHAKAQEELGFVMAEDGEYVFESALDEYFDDFVDEDAESFVNRLYETLRADMAKYEVEMDVG